MFRTLAVAMSLFATAGVAEARGFGGFHYSYHYSPAHFSYHYGGGYGEHIDPLRPVSPVRPVTPVRPVRPVDPVRPLRPVDPVRPVPWNTAFDRVRFPTDLGLSHYSALGARGLHNTAYWSRDFMTSRGNYVRANFGFYHCFHGDWFGLHPRCWRPFGWDDGFYWRWMNWALFTDWCSFDRGPIYYNYGDNVLYLGDQVYEGGQQYASATQYAEQAATLAAQGENADTPQQEQWKPLGVFALVQGSEKNSNNLFQLAVNKAGVIRGNYYDGVQDSTTEIIGQIDKKTQRAAWTIGKKADRVFDCGAANLTQPEAPLLVHLGKDRTEQMLLVRINPPGNGK